jgi:UDP-N-acetyl-D-glucosamine dehydrogenase
MNILQKIESREAVVAVIGLGYVGLPLAVAFAEAGFRVIGIDINKERVDAINRGESYVTDVPSAEVAALVSAESPEHASTHSGGGAGLHQPLPAVKSLTLQRAKRLSATTDCDALNDADAVIICVPTPLDKIKNPDMTYIVTVTGEIGKRLHDDMLIVLESTTYPGTTKEIVLPLLEEVANPRVKAGSNGHTPGGNGNGSQSAINRGQIAVGKDFFLAFSPERIDPGRTDYTIRTTPKVLGGVTPQCTEVAQTLYSTIIDQVVPVSSPRVAEMVKLLENTFRAVNIALVNEVVIMCDRLGIDVWEVIDAAKTKPFGFMTFYPGPGLGGHCIPIDPEYLAWKLKTLNYNARFIQLAAEVNFNMPQYVLDKIMDALNEDGKPLNGSTVLVLGVAYKADISDLRESPALDLIQLLHDKGAKIAYHDPYVPQLTVNGLKLTSSPLEQETLQTADCTVITTAHSSYDWSWVVKNSRLVVDTRNATKGVAAGPARIVKL